MPRVDQAVKRAATKRRSALSSAMKLSGEKQQQELESLKGIFSAQLASCEQAAADEAATASTAVMQADAAESELAKENAAGERLYTLMAHLQHRQQAVISQREELIHAEERERNELSDYFKSRIEEVNEGLTVQGSDRVTNLNENEKLHSALLALANEYSNNEKLHASLVREATAMHATLEAEFEELQRSHDALNEEEEMLVARERAYAASDQELRARLTEYAEEFEQVQVDLKETNKRYNEHSAALTTATLRLREAERSHQASNPHPWIALSRLTSPVCTRREVYRHFDCICLCPSISLPFSCLQALKALKSEQSKVLKQLRSTLKDREDQLARVVAQCDKLRTVREQLRVQVDVTPSNSSSSVGEPGSTRQPASIQT